MFYCNIFEENKLAVENKLNQYRQGHFAPRVLFAIKVGTVSEHFLKWSTCASVVKHGKWGRRFIPFWHQSNYNLSS